MNEAAPRIVIVGAGFAGLEAGYRLAGSGVDLTVIDRHNYHLFQPLLYQVATAILQPADIGVPVRRMLARRAPALVLMSEVTGIDPESRMVRTRDRAVPYDYLVLAPGSETSYFGNDHLRGKTFGLKSLSDAAHLRSQFLLAFERAEMIDDAAERERLMTFVVVGGGANGVSTAVAMSELARQILAQDFRRINAKATRIILAEAGQRILPAMPDMLADYAARTLTRKGVEIRVDSEVEDVVRGGVVISGERVPTETVVWTAGVVAPQIKTWLDVPCDKAGRVEVSPDLSVPGHDGIFVVGDAAHLDDAEGNPLPGLAAVAKQQGRYVAEVIGKRIAGEPPPGPFAYRDYGELVPLGRGKAIARLMGDRYITGFTAWIVWAGVHVAFLMDMRRRLMVSFNWFWAYLTSRRGARVVIDRVGTDIEVAGRRGAATPPSVRDGDRREAG